MILMTPAMASEPYWAAVPWRRPQGPPPPEAVEHFVTTLAEYGVVMQETPVLQE